VYAPLTVALIVFGIVGIIVLVTCFIYWHRHRHQQHDKSTTLQRTKSYRATLVASDDAAPPTSTPNGRLAPPSIIITKSGLNHSSKEDAFSQAVSPVQPNATTRWPSTLEGGSGR
jgi:hypothetical protein